MSREQDINKVLVAMQQYVAAHAPERVAGWWTGLAESALDAGNAELEAKIARVREIHKPYGAVRNKGTQSEHQYCEGCGEESLDEYPVAWPCATIRALEDTDTYLARRKREERKAAAKARRARDKREAREIELGAKDGFNIKFVDSLEDA